MSTEHAIYNFVSFLDFCMTYFYINNGMEAVSCFINVRGFDPIAFLLEDAACRFVFG